MRLRKGFTTGSCAAAAAAAAAQALLTQKSVKNISITMPSGKNTTFSVSSCKFDKNQASAMIIKNAGDDPDVTHGIEIIATIKKNTIKRSPSLTITGGKGVGIVTKPGLPVEAGLPAINPVPRQMIHDNVLHLLNTYNTTYNNYTITISVPQGKTVSKKTLNKRLGIIGGISILGTTGIVEPLSLRAYQQVIDTCLDMASAQHLNDIVFTTGRTTEKIAQGYLSYKENSFIIVGDHMGYALLTAFNKGFHSITLLGQLGKFSKIAGGKFDTHAYRADLNFSHVARWSKKAGCNNHDQEFIKKCNTMAQVSSYFLNKKEGKRFFKEICLAVCRSSFLFLKNHICPAQKKLSIRSIIVSPKGEILADVKK